MTSLLQWSGSWRTESQAKGYGHLEGARHSKGADFSFKASRKILSLLPCFLLQRDLSNLQSCKALNLC